MKKHMTLFTDIDLTLFDGAGGGAPAAAPAAEGSTNDAGNGTQGATGEQSKANETVPDRDAEFESMIKGDFRDPYQKRMEAAMNDRHKKYKGMETTLTTLEAEKGKMAPALELLASRYGVDPSNTDALVKAISEDSAYYEAEAMERGLTVDQLKEFKKLEKDSKAYAAWKEEQERKDNSKRIYDGWEAEAEAMRTDYPTFDLKTESEHPETGARFTSMLSAGVSVKDAYHTVHMHEILGGAMQYAAKTAVSKAVNNIRANGMRPEENGGSGAGAVNTPNVKKLTREQHKKIADRVMRGEIVRL